MKRIKFILLPLLLVLALFTPVQGDTTRKIDLTTNKLTLTVGKTYNIKIKNTAVTWKEVNGRHIKLTKTGKLYVKKAGRVRIRYSYVKCSKKITNSITLRLKEPKEKKKEPENIPIPTPTPTPKPLLGPEITPEPTPVPERKPVATPAPTPSSDTVIISPAPEPDTEQHQYVWLSETGSKYHSINNCGNMNPNKARKVTLEYAISEGYDRCSKCF